VFHSFRSFQLYLPALRDKGIEFTKDIKSEPYIGPLSRLLFVFGLLLLVGVIKFADKFRGVHLPKFDGLPFNLINGDLYLVLDLPLNILKRPLELKLSA
jgi:hypothetical protein